MLLEETACEPYEKDYDLIDKPVRWAQLWNLSTWVMLSADKGGRRLGGCIVAQGTCGIDLLEERTDIAALWDLRVCPRHRREGIGAALFEAAVAWARERGCSMMNLETQNNNVPACRLYASYGSELRSIKRGHYKNFPNETQLIWQKAL